MLIKKILAKKSIPPKIHPPKTYNHSTPLGAGGGVRISQGDTNQGGDTIAKNVLLLPHWVTPRHQLSRISGVVRGQGGQLSPMTIKQYTLRNLRNPCGLQKCRNKMQRNVTKSCKNGLVFGLVG